MKSLLIIITLLCMAEGRASADAVLAAVDDKLVSYLAPTLAGEGWTTIPHHVPVGDAHPAGELRESAVAMSAFGAFWVEDSPARLAFVEASAGTIRYAPLPRPAQELSGTTVASIALSLLEEARFGAVVVHVDVHTEVRVETPSDGQGDTPSVVQGELPAVQSPVQNATAPVIADPVAPGAEAERATRLGGVRLELTAGIDSWIFGGAQLGTERWHFLVSLGLQARVQALAVGGGFGVNVELSRRTFLNLDGLLHYVRVDQFSANRERFGNGAPEFVAQLRATFGLNLRSGIALIGGIGLAGSASYRLPNETDARASWALRYHEEEIFFPAPQTRRWQAAVWPTVFVGVQVF